MDGNGRWARNRGKPRRAGHKAGADAVRSVVEHAARRGTGYLTLFAFSSENWRRPREEVSNLMSLFGEALRREVKELHRNNVRVRFVGDLGSLSASLAKKIAAAENKTIANTGLELIVAVAYGGRWDLVNATRQVALKVEAGALRAADIGEEDVASGLQLAGVPDPDLLIRTGGEQRISNFLLWNLAYTELWFSDVLWPDFGEQEFDRALAFFATKQRRFGHTGEQVGAV